MDYIPVCTDAAITNLADIASEIWNEYWPEHIGQGQTSYMVQKFQSKAAITQAIKQDGYQYFLLVVDGTIIGYSGVHIETENQRLFLSKLYLFKDCRGHGYAREVIEFYAQLCRVNHLDSIYLTVNKGNQMAITAYLKNGFVTIDSVETDIGENYIMDDYIMEKTI